MGARIVCPTRKFVYVTPNTNKSPIEHTIGTFYNSILYLILLEGWLNIIHILLAYSLYARAHTASMNCFSFLTLSKKRNIRLGLIKYNLTVNKVEHIFNFPMISDWKISNLFQCVYKNLLVVVKGKNKRA